MRRLVLALALAAAACTAGPRGEFKGPRLKPAADPSAVIAAELAFNRLAQKKGQWTAFLERAAPDAQLFVPQRVPAAAWLKGRANPPVSVRWQPNELWSSCDGSHAVTRGSWQRPGSTGSFVTVWQRQKDGGYKWLLDQSVATDEPSIAADVISAKVADCDGRPPVIAAAVGRTDGTVEDSETASSDDGTLVWTSSVFPSGERQFAVRIWQGGELREVLSHTEKALPAAVR